MLQLEVRTLIGKILRRNSQVCYRKKVGDIHFPGQRGEKNDNKPAMLPPGWRTGVVGPHSFKAIGGWQVSNFTKCLRVLVTRLSLKIDANSPRRSVSRLPQTVQTGYETSLSHFSDSLTNPLMVRHIQSLCPHCSPFEKYDSRFWMFSLKSTTHQRRVGKDLFSFCSKNWCCVL